MSTSAAITRLVIDYATSSGCRVITEIHTGGGGEQRVSITRWNGARQLGQAVEFPIPRTSRLAAVPEAVAKAIAADGG